MTRPSADPAAPGPAPLRPLSVHVYHHTHWDREWWGTRERFRFRLMHTVDAVLGALDADPALTCFVLDGQTIILTDYLEVRPAERERVSDLIRAGRLFVGPWHILPDEFLVSGEATIRNLWLGRRVAAALDVPLSGVGYLPDQFGHTAQMPQILRGFGIDSAVVWRGFGAPPLGGDDGDGEVGHDIYRYARSRDPRFPARTQNEFWWEAPDGTRVLGIYLPLEYYRSHHKERADDPEFTRDQTHGRARRTLAHLGAYSATGVVLEPLGGDHLPVDPRLPRLLREIGAELDGEGVTYRLSSLDAYVAAVREHEERISVVWPGEGRAFGRKAHLLPAVLSARMPLKQRNARAQSELERYAEPLQALAGALGERHESDYLWHAWDTLIQNHPHDSICGCSTDQVHREMVTRFDEAEQAAAVLAEDALGSVLARVDTAFAGGGQVIGVFNPLNWPRSELTTALLSPHLEITPEGWALHDEHGSEVPFQVQVHRHPTDKSEPWSWLPRAGHRSHDNDVFTAVSFVATDVPGIGYRTYALRPRDVYTPQERVRPYAVAGNVALDKGHHAAELQVGPGTLENAHLKVTVEPDGSVTLLDRASGQTYAGLNTFDDGGDNGDTYNYAWPLGDQILSSAGATVRTEWVEVGPARATLRVTRRWALPAGLSADRQSRSADDVPFVIHSDLTLTPGARRLDIRTHGENTARDHRLRALFPLGGPATMSSAESQFAVVDRPTALPDDQRGSSEPAVHEHPQQSFVSVWGGVRGLTVANRGLPEFSAGEDGTLRLTLLRCVGYLSRDDLLTRVGGAGPTIPTPDAQLLGPFEAEYSVIPHAGTWDDAQVWQGAHAFNAPLRAQARTSQVLPLRNAHRDEAVTLPPSGQLVDLDGGVLLSALKRAENGEALIVRFVNLSAAARDATLRAHWSVRRAARVDLREHELAELPVADGTVTVATRPWEIVTVALHLEAR
ncbi:alpha-mannosidase [Deinococcus metalli]|uniref:Alpha-mannosidase n=1 Tax=Deinococcus metalli TaxID=1141878 RepID=A0A7W8KH25_9DEIO|nr:glycoside hydrolase family 38 C-terminal domain-containing protein [Deinococcus metalli]MBB5377980.1 alpha-mannosidase [Deinococcus metalli]GHF53516.1 alpha-mannosidase [Deinococcus metalli]